MKSSFNSLYLFFICIGFGSLALGIRNYYQEKAIFAKAEQASATLTKYVPDPNARVADFCPVFEFTTKAGEDVSYVGEDCPSQPDSSKIGQPGVVYFDPKNPQVIETRGWLGSEGSGLISGTIGCVFFSGMAIVPMLITALRKLLKSNRNQ